MRSCTVTTALAQLISVRPNHNLPKQAFLEHFHAIVSPRFSALDSRSAAPAVYLHYTTHTRFITDGLTTDFFLSQSLLSGEKTLANRRVLAL